jgi:hypothetical protein
MIAPGPSAQAARPSRDPLDDAVKKQLEVRAVTIAAGFAG